MRVAICDDDRESCARLRSLIRKQKPDCEVTCFDTGRRFLEARKHFDILLLDIQMEEMSGIEVARVLRINQEKTILIFVTALKEYAAEAFEVSAFSYLLKPVEPEKFCRVFPRRGRLQGGQEDGEPERRAAFLPDEGQEFFGAEEGNPVCGEP